MKRMLRRNVTGKRPSDPRGCWENEAFDPQTFCAIFEKTACILAGGMVKYKTVVSKRRENPVNMET